MLRKALPTLLLALLGAAVCDVAHADAPSRPWRPRPPGFPRPPAPASFQLDLVDEARSPLRTFAQAGRRYVLGSFGQRYRIRIANPTASRVEAVISVDGLDANDGATASLTKRGYVIPAFGEITIDGFRTSLDTVAAFRFSSVRGSYAGRKGQDRSVGVIGVALFRERAAEQPVEIARPTRSKPRAGAAPPSPGAGRSADASAAERGPSRDARRRQERPGLGTAFGEERASSVRETTFVREGARPVAQLELRYNDRDGLVALGIPVPPEPVAMDGRDDIQLREAAEPFPRRRRFATPPR